MTLPKALDAHLVVRVTRRTWSEFHEKCKPYGKPSDVLREIVDAFLEDRLSIEPNPNRKSLYQQ